MTAGFTGFGHIRCVLFDLDGTLLDSAPDLGAAANALRVARGMPALPLTAYRSSAGAGARGMLNIAFGMDPSHAEYPDMREKFLASYARCMTERTRPFAGVELLLAELHRRRIAWGVVTNKMHALTEPLTRALPLFAGASAIISGDTTAHAKPHPAPVLAALEQIGVAPGESLMVGDDARDMLSGRAAGVGTVAARYGYLGVDADPAQWAADAGIDAPLELLNLLATP